ncbi:MAG: VWA domain-containing protein [Planctomycetes bacterium]|nr:VWA domain-containing protein [Planctomycetota bacterium]
MEWLAPWAGGIAAAIAVPALVALYFLKLKRQERLVTSTLLWRRAVQDLRVNAPFRMIRNSILLILQLLALAVLLVALARPVVQMRSTPSSRVVLLIDRSASMNATDVQPSRLDEAKRQARAMIDALREKRTWSLSDEAEQAMVIAFDRSAQVLCTFTADKSKLREAVDAIEPTDNVSKVAEAIAVARAFATPRGAETNNRSSETPARIELFSDGRIADLDDVLVSEGELTFHAVGTSADNVAVIALEARRPFDQPNRVEIFANLANFGGDTVTSDVQLGINGNVKAVRSIELPPLTAGTNGKPDQPGQTSVSFSLADPEPGVLEVRLMRDDALAVDNVAWAILQPPKRLGVLLVTEGNSPLESALRACPIAKLQIHNTSQFEAMDHEAMSLERPYGLIVLDRCEVTRLPAANCLVFGQPPKLLGLGVKGQAENQFVIDWRSKHPVLNHVNLGNLFVSKCLQLDVPREGTVLAEFDAGPALVMVRRPGGMALVAPFDLLESNWPFESGFVMFCYNVVTFLGAEVEQGQSASLPVGQPIVVQSTSGQAEATIVSPQRGEEKLTADPSGKFRYGGTSRVGLYRFTASGGTERIFAVNLLDAGESYTAPSEQLAVSGQQIEAQGAEAVMDGRELWPWLVGLGLLVVLIEWWVYTGKVRI